MLEPGHRFREQPPGSGRLRPARCLCLDLGGALYRWGYVWWSSRNLCTGGKSHTVSSVTWAQRGGGLGARALPPPGRPPSRSPLLRTASWKAQLTQGHPTRAGIRVRLGRSIDEAGVYSTDGVVRTLPLTWPLLLPLVGNSSRGEGGRPGLSCHFTPRPLRELNRAHGSDMAPIAQASQGPLRPGSSPACLQRLGACAHSWMLPSLSGSWALAVCCRRAAALVGPLAKRSPTVRWRGSPKTAVLTPQGVNPASKLPRADRHGPHQRF